MNLHTPKRGQDETFADYKSRRKQSHIANGLPGSSLFIPTKRQPQQTSDRAMRRASIALAGGIRQYKRLKNGGWAKV